MRVWHTIELPHTVGGNWSVARVIVCVLSRLSQISVTPGYDGILGTVLWHSGGNPEGTALLCEAKMFVIFV